nr:hypothetical protein [Pyrinomonadaceae bacterium]
CRNEIQNYQYLDEADRQKVSAENWGNWQAKEVLKNKAGPDFGVNNLFVAVATAADLDVRIIYTGDRRSFVFANNKFAHRSLLIYSGIAVKTAKGWHYCYPSMKYTPANHLYWFSEGQDALLIGKKESEWVKLPIAPPEYNKSEQKANLKLLPDGTLEGTVKNTYYGFIGTDSKLGFKDLSEKYIKESIENIWKGRFDKFEIENVSINKSVWFNEPFEIQYKIKVFDYARSTEKRMIFQPGFFEYGIKPKFQDSTRFTPIYFDKSNWDLQEVEIEIPQNYETEALNLSRKVSEAGIVDFEVNIGFDPQRNTLKYRRNFKYGENGRLLYPVNSYPLLKNIFDRISLIDSDVITLKKKT